MLMLFTMLSAALLTAPAVGVKGEAERPKGPPPLVMLAEVPKDGTPYLEQVRVRHVPQIRVVEGVVGGRVRKRHETVFVPVQEAVRLSLAAKGVTVFGTDGKPIDSKEVGKLLNKPTAVLVSADGKPVDPFYLRLAREG